MKILIDTNRIIAALSKGGASRDIILDHFFEFVTPEYTVEEIENHKDELIKKTKLSNEEFGSLLALLFERIMIIPESEFKEILSECRNDISDQDDIPHLAACLATKAEGIWTHDTHFKEQQKAKIFTNIDMLNIIRKAASKRNGEN